MKAGRELGALVAEKVMGRSGDVERKVLRDVQTGMPTYVERWGVPAYSTDIAAAWEVVEKLQAANPFWETAGNESFMAFYLAPALDVTKGRVDWAANFGDDRTLAYGTTAPLAICLAALKAVGA
jgi:hypothetical protein